MRDNAGLQRSCVSAFLQVASLFLVFCFFTAAHGERTQLSDGPLSVVVTKTMPSMNTDRSVSKPQRLVIFLHGIGGSGSVMAAIGSSWTSTLTDTKFVAPDAPFAYRSGGHQWFAVDDQVLRPGRIQAARRSFDELISGIVRREGFENDLDKVAFVGVSQGAIMGLDAVSSGRWRIGALVSFAGLLPLPPEPLSGTTTPVLLLHGGADQTIPPAASQAAAGQLKSVGYDVSLKVFPNVGHTISSKEARDALAFLRTNLDP